MSKAPLVSVVMSVYNGEAYVRQSIDSILGQSFTDFEFVIIDDGSTDKTKKILQSYNDSRIVLISRPNKGLVASLNEGIAKSRGIFIARQDDDDTSEPNRLQEEVRYLQEHPAIGLVGSFAQLVTADGVEAGSYTVPYKGPDLRRRLFLGNTLVHGSIMVRKEMLPTPAYVSTYGPTEDYVLWGKLSQKTEMAVIPQFLYTYKINEGSPSIFNSRENPQLVEAAREELWAKASFPSDGILAIVRRGRHYKQSIHKEVYLQFLGDQQALITMLWQKQKRLSAIQIFLALTLMRPRFAASLLKAKVRS